MRVPAVCEIDRAPATVTASINDLHLSEFRAGHVQAIITEGAPALTVDDGVAPYDGSGARVGTIPRLDSGRWIAERQNVTADRSTRAVPTQPPWSRVRTLLTVRHVRG
jgi:hypothetical protein